jgi:DNA-binding IclR family transcriptional regulator
VEKVASPGLIQISSYVGLRWPLHTSAVGKALLAFLSESDRQELLNTLPLTKLTPRTITSKPVLMKELQLFRARGFTWEINEGEVGVACVAAPIFGAQGQLLAAISLTGTTSQISKTTMKPLGALVKRYAGIISGQLGGGRSAALA